MSPDLDALIDALAFGVGVPCVVLGLDLMRRCFARYFAPGVPHR